MQKSFLLSGAVLGALLIFSSEIVFAADLPTDRGVRFISPVTGGKCRITSDFGERRHPITGKIEGHGAYDFAGSPLKIRAPAGGTVTDVGRNKTCGEFVEIKHSGNLYTHYCHIKKRSIKVRIGQSVAAGVELGTVGTTGRSTGPHLHWVVKTQPGFDTSKKSYLDPVGPYMMRGDLGCGAVSEESSGQEGRR